MTTMESRRDALGEATLGELAQALRGELVRPDDRRTTRPGRSGTAPTTGGPP